ncbi:hypothetical protein HUT03_00475 [Candidatus Liberibacter africanus]|uniref:Lipoprotein n=1 Tax=Candidatus Liberibacter africanus PTSAPSY TaxID=1277257 RepID=A0A0G3I1K0_LIBAF|nr:hypothetical protein [Candidatus Liberibacter africanus]AKK19751.1 hypothetical protein G293_00515 [Candidatus Liberibacter africanus PTSAPSY]QTP63630.1 hypothetical protein HUT03_00475 [Candidatus Liberibacter africanus]
MKLKTITILTFIILLSGCEEKEKITADMINKIKIKIKKYNELTKANIITSTNKAVLNKDQLDVLIEKESDHGVLIHGLQDLESANQKNIQNLLKDLNNIDKAMKEAVNPVEKVNKSLRELITDFNKKFDDRNNRINKFKEDLDNDIMKVAKAATNRNTIKDAMASVKVNLNDLFKELPDVIDKAKQKTTPDINSITKNTFDPKLKGDIMDHLKDNIKIIKSAFENYNTATSAMDSDPKDTTDLSNKNDKETTNGTNSITPNNFDPKLNGNENSVVSKSAERKTVYGTWLGY